jgi:hypothetical protein
MQSTKKFSVIIPDTDSTRLSRILAALRSQTTGLADGEVLVVGSDRPAQVVCDESVRFIPTDADQSCASDKRNLGMHLAHGEIFFFLDDDCIPRLDWIECLLQRHSRGDQIVGGAVELAGRNYLQLADNLSAFHDLLPYTPAGNRNYLCTSNLSLHRSVVERAGFMEPHQNRADDLEWTARFRQSGYQLYFEPRAIVLHDPDRCSLSTVWRHWLVDAPSTLRVRLLYPGLLGTPRLARYRSFYLWGAPFVASWATLRTFSHPRSLLNYGHTLPLVYLTKLIWCWSAYQHFPDRG